MPTDHYQTLGVHPGADADEVRAAYLRLMRANHPDRRPGDPVAADTARRANVAYAVLRDTSEPARLDRARQPGRAVNRPAVETLRASARASRAYSEAQMEYRRAFSRACLRVGLVVLVLGMAVLLSL